MLIQNNKQKVQKIFHFTHLLCCIRTRFNLKKLSVPFFNQCTLGGGNPCVLHTSFNFLPHFNVTSFNSLTFAGFTVTKEKMYVIFKIFVLY